MKSTLLKLKLLPNSIRLLIGGLVLTGCIIPIFAFEIIDIYPEVEVIHSISGDPLNNGDTIKNVSLINAMITDETGVDMSKTYFKLYKNNNGSWDQVPVSGLSVKPEGTHTYRLQTDAYIIEEAEFRYEIKVTNNFGNDSGITGTVNLIPNRFEFQQPEYLVDNDETLEFSSKKITYGAYDQFDLSEPTDVEVSLKSLTGDITQLTIYNGNGEPVIIFNGEDPQVLFSKYDFGAQNSILKVKIKAPATQTGKVELKVGIKDEYGGRLGTTIIDVNNPVGYWKFENNFADSSGNENNGINGGGVSFNSGITGQAAKFNGTSGFIKVDNTDADFDFTGDYTVSAWIKPAGFGGFQGIVGKGVKGQAGWGLQLQNNNVNFGYHGCSNFSSPKTLNADEWYHVVGVYRGNGSEEIYINGELSITGQVTQPNCGNHVGDLVIGSMNSVGGGDFFNGLIDEVKIYPRALSANILKKEYSRGIGLLAHYDFDRNFLDQSGNGFHGTENGGVVFTDGRLEQGAGFDGADDFIEVTDINNFPAGGEARTISLWMNQNSLVDGIYGSLVSYGGAESGQTYAVQIASVYGNTYVFSDGRNSINNIVISGDEIPSLNFWHHIVFVYDGDSSWEYYLDGVLKKSGTFSIPIDTKGDHFLIGIRDDVVKGHFNGILDEIKIYNRPLSDKEITREYSRGLGLLAHYPLDGSAEDVSGFDHHGTAQEINYGEGLMNEAGFYDPAKGSTIAVADHSDLSPGLVSVNVWAKLDGPSKDNNWQVLTWKHTDYEISVNNNKYPRFGIRTDGGRSLCDADPGLITYGIWHQYTLTYDGTKIRGYLDGEEVVSCTHAHPGNVTDSTYAFEMGDNSPYLVDGSIDDARIFNRPLTPEEIKKSYNDGYGLVAHYQMDGDMTDNSGNDNHGRPSSTESVYPLTASMLSHSGLTEFDAAQIVDGDTNTHGWHTNDSLIDAWLKIDLGSGNAQAFTGINVYASIAGYGGLYTIQYSDNGSVWQEATTSFWPKEAGDNFRAWGDVGTHRFWRLYLANTPDAGAWLNELQFFTADYALGKTGQAVNFDGAKDCVLISDDETLDIESSISLEAWIKPEGIGKGPDSDWGGMILAKHYTHKNRAYDIALNSDKTIRFGLIDTYDKAYILNTETPLNNHQWYHVVATYSRVSGNARVYIDGKLAKEVYVGKFDLMQTDIPVTIGCYLKSTDGSVLRTFFKGQIDEAKIYKRALNEAEVNMIYHTYPICGDPEADPPVREENEACDDGATEPYDGCDRSCQIEPGWTCDESGCEPIYGDGLFVGPENCDDGNTITGDGCDAAGQVEDGWQCAGMPSLCFQCGNGEITPGIFDSADEFLIGHYTFEGDAKDKSDKRNHGRRENPLAPYKPGKFGLSAQFTKETDTVFVPSQDYLNWSDTNRRSVSLWFFAQNTTGKQVLYEEGGVDQGINIYLDGATLYVHGYNKDLGWQGTSFSKSNIQSDTWYHIVVTLDGGSVLADDRLKAYFNGDRFGSGKGVKLTSRNEVGIGGVNNGTLFHDNTTAGYTGYNFKGRIDDVKIYNAVLSPKEVLDESEKAPQDMVAYYKFDDNKYHNILSDDYYGVARNGAQTYLGVSGEAVYLDGEDDYVLVNNGPELTDAVTVLAWVKVNGTTTQDYQRVVCAANEYYCFWIQNDGTARVRLEGTTKKDSFVQTAFLNVQIPKGSWQHVGFTYDGTHTYFYLNGIKYESDLASQGSDYYSGNLATQTGELHIGESPIMDRPFNGAIDEVKIFAQALTEAEVRYHWQDTVIEECDDAGDSGEGCSDTCQISENWTCVNEPSECYSCGNGYIEAVETCDDANTEDGDGCDHNCQQEDGYVCSGTPSVCETTVGDGVISGDERCDDGNTIDGDGCSANGEIESPDYGLVGYWSFDGDMFNHFFNASDAGATSKIKTDGIKEVDGEMVFYEGAPRTVLTSDFLPVSSAEEYIIYGKFRSAHPTIQSNLYFGFAPYDADKNSITAQHVLRNGETDLLISSINDQQIVVNKDISGWYQTGTMAYQRSLGFYYDGDTSKVPDSMMYSYPSGYLGSTSYAYSRDEQYGTYYQWEGDTVYLNEIVDHLKPSWEDIKSNIVPGTSKVMNHYSGGSYLYCAAGNSKVPQTWTEYDGKITGEAFGNAACTFRPGTKYVKIMFLLNYSPGPHDSSNPTYVAQSQAEIQFNDIRLYKPNSVYKDLSGHDNNLRNYRGSGFVDSEFGKAATFDGVDDGLGVPVFNNSPQKAISMGLWFKADDQNKGKGYARLIELGDDSSDSTAIVIDSDLNGTITGFRYWVYTNGKRTEREVGTDYDYHDDRWHHIMMTYDGYQMKLYIDGALRNTTEVEGGGDIDSAPELNIGQHDAVDGGSDHTFKGQMDEIKVYNRALWADEVLDFYTEEARGSIECGNGRVEGSEECDDGNKINGDGCTSLCTLEASLCGNNIEDEGEQCDKGEDNGVPGSGCDIYCREFTAAIPFDGEVQDGEECDDGNDDPDDGCDSATGTLTDIDETTGKKTFNCLGEETTVCTPINSETSQELMVGFDGQVTQRIGDEYNNYTYDMMENSEAFYDGLRFKKEGSLKPYTDPTAVDTLDEANEGRHQFEWTTSDGKIPIKVKALLPSAEVVKVKSDFGEGGALRQTEKDVALTLTYRKVNYKGEPVMDADDGSTVYETIALSDPDLSLTTKFRPWVENWLRTDDFELDQNPNFLVPESLLMPEWIATEQSDILILFDDPFWIFAYDWLGDPYVYEKRLPRLLGAGLEFLMMGHVHPQAPITFEEEPIHEADREFETVTYNGTSHYAKSQERSMVIHSSNEAIMASEISMAFTSLVKYTVEDWVKDGEGLIKKTFEIVYPGGFLGHDIAGEGLFDEDIAVDELIGDGGDIEVKASVIGACIDTGGKMISEREFYQEADSENKVTVLSSQKLILDESSFFDLKRNEASTDDYNLNGIDFTNDNTLIFVGDPTNKHTLHIRGEVTGVGTIVAVNANIFITGDLTYSDPSSSSLGVILLNETSDGIMLDDIQTEPEYGNVFIHRTAQKIVGTYFAYGAFISTNIDISQIPSRDDSQGDPPKVFFTSSADDYGFEKQLLLEGAFRTINTRGGGLPTNGNYKIPSSAVFPAESEDNARWAQQYDINFIRRYAGGEDNCVKEGNPEDCISKNCAFVIRPDYKISSGDLTPPGFKAASSMSY